MISLIEPWSRSTWGTAAAIVVLSIVVTLIVATIRAGRDVAEQTRDWRDPRTDDSNNPWDHGA